MEDKSSYSNKSDEAKEEAKEIAVGIFEERVWSHFKQDMKEASRKDACRFMFAAGFITYMGMMDEQMRELEEDAKNNPKEFEKALNLIKEELEEKQNE